MYFGKAYLFRLIYSLCLPCSMISSCVLSQSEVGQLTLCHFFAGVNHEDLVVSPLSVDDLLHLEVLEAALAMLLVPLPLALVQDVVLFVH